MQYRIARPKGQIRAEKSTENVSSEEQKSAAYDNIDWSFDRRESWPMEG
jgi:hypothetical protein